MARTDAIEAVQKAKQRRDTRGQAEAEKRAYEATHAILAQGRTVSRRIKLWPVVRGVFLRDRRG